jgi:hypothetical protein
MGTRGLFGFYYKNKFYVVYNHLDSYPEHLGKLLVEEITEAVKSGQVNSGEVTNGEVDQWMEMLEKIIWVDDGHTDPTPEDIERLKPYTDLSVSSRSELDWYCLLRGTQGSMKKVLECGYMMNQVNSDGVPYFQEYAYILNFDTKKFDFYEGDVCKESFELSELPKW